MVAIGNVSCNMCQVDLQSDIFFKCHFPVHRYQIDKMDGDV